MITMVSFVPFPVKLDYPTVLPNSFELTESDTVTPVTKLVPENAFYWYDPGMERPKYKIAVTEQEFADSIIRDYVGSQMASGPDARPALFYVDGFFDAKKNADKVTEAKRQQNNWFSLLVKQADVDYIQSKNNPFVVSDLARRAARLINVERQWLDVDTRATQCPVCRMNIHPLAIKCGHCNAILNQAEYDKYKFVEK